MARDGYVGLNNVARRLKKGYVGVNGVARRLKKGYLGVNGVARLCWVATQTWAKYEKQAVYVQNGPTQTSYSGSESGSMPNITTSSTYTFSADTGKFTLVNPTTSQHGGGSVNGYMIGGGYGETGSVMRSSIYVAKRTSSALRKPQSFTFIRLIRRPAAGPALAFCLPPASGPRRSAHR